MPPVTRRRRPPDRYSPDSDVDDDSSLWTSCSELETSTDGSDDGDSLSSFITDDSDTETPTADDEEEEECWSSSECESDV
jgi:hypothetical protein